MTPAEVAVRSAIAERGPIPFTEVVETALYHPVGGFYAAGGRAGRRGDFLTSPEVGPLFGAVVARALDAWWDEADRPDVFPVVEVGAGPGTLARSVLAAGPRCGAALHYVVVERSADQRALHAELPAGVESSAEIPPLPELGVVLANELLDNLPFGILERTVAGWSEVYIGVDGDALVEVLMPSAAGPPADAEPGARAPLQTVAADWVTEARALAGPRGRVLAIDYASTTGELARRPWTQWVRTYRQHERGGHPLDLLGRQDITCEVAVDQLPTPSADRSQHEWLRAHGIDELVAEGQATWKQRAVIGDLEALRAWSRVTEAEALLDERGLGAFRVLEWTAPT